MSPLPDPISQFIAALFETGDVVEVRALRANSKPERDWCLPQEMQDPESGIRQWIERHRADQWNIYVGVNPRKTSRGGSAADVALARCHFVDLDGVNPEAVSALIRDAGLPEPTLLIASGHGAHAYWRLEEPTTDLPRWTGCQKQLITMLGSDAVIHDPPRIMRLPGTTNWKNDPAVECLILQVGPGRINLAVEPVAEKLVTPTAVPPADHPWFKQLSRASLQFLQFGAMTGNRNTALFNAACDLKGCGAPMHEALPLLSSAAHRAGLEDWEIEGCVRSAYSKHRNPSRPPETAEGGNQDGEDADDSSDKAGSQRDRVVRLAMKSYWFGKSPQNELFAVPIDGPYRAHMLRGGRNALQAELACRFCETYGTVPGSTAIADAMQVLHGMAMLGEQRAVNLRYGRHDGNIVIDLGEDAGRAVVVTPLGWKIEPRSPVLFRHTPLTRAMPAPVCGGSLDQIRRLLHVSEAAWPLALAWQIASFMPDLQHPIVLVGGQQDAGKSTTARFLSTLIDPSVAPLQAPPRDLEQWAVTAAGSQVVVIDNISHIPDWLSDALCRAVTGEALVRRQLFTSDDLCILVFQRSVILTSIDTGALKGDLGRRLIMLELEPLTETEKRPPAQLNAEFEAQRPAMLGALLDLLGKVLARLPHIKLDRHHGLADFELVCAAVDEVLGTDALGQYRGQWERIAADVLDADAVASALLGFAQRACQAGPWVGRASDLLAAITPDPVPREWPKSAKGFGGQLRRAAPVLKHAGIEVIPPSPNDKTRKFTLRLITQTARPPGDVVGEASGDRADQSGSYVGTIDRPVDRPMKNATDGPAEGPSGRSGGSGGSMYPFPDGDGYLIGDAEGGEA